MTGKVGSEAGKAMRANVVFNKEIMKSLTKIVVSRIRKKKSQDALDNDEEAARFGNLLNVEATGKRNQS